MRTEEERALFFGEITLQEGWPWFDYNNFDFGPTAGQRAGYLEFSFPLDASYRYYIRHFIAQWPGAGAGVWPDMGISREGFDPQQQGESPEILFEAYVRGNPLQSQRIPLRTLTTPGSTHDQFIAATVSPNTSGSISGSVLYNPIEYPSATWGRMSSSGERCAVIQSKGIINLNTICGVSRGKYEADDTYSSLMGSSPSQAILISFATCAADGSDNLSAVALVEIVYHVLCYDRITTN